MGKRSVIYIALTLSLLQARGEPAEWGSLRRIPPEQHVRITIRGGEVMEGRFQGWSPDAITLRHHRQPRSLAYADVRRIDVQQKGSRWKGAMWGAVIGFATLFTCGAASAGYITDRNNPPVGTRIETGAGAGMLGAGVGAAIGALAGASRFVTIYRAEQRQ
jgi:hypothetical protein